MIAWAALCVSTLYTPWWHRGQPFESPSKCSNKSCQCRDCSYYSFCYVATICVPRQYSKCTASVAILIKCNLLRCLQLID